jgi:large subunit ribosomal protein L18
MGMRLVGRDRRKVRIRKKVTGTPERPRLTAFRSARHIYAQVIDDVNGCTLAHVSTMSKDVRDANAQAEKKPKKTEQATQVGALIAKMCLSKEIGKVVFDRNGYKYHGRVSALAAAARKAGLKF